MSFDDHIRKALDRALVGVRGHLETDFRAFAEDLLRAAAEERGRAVKAAADNAAGEVRRQALEQLSQLRDLAQKHTDELRRAAESQINELKSALEDARRSAAQQVEAARRGARAEIDELRRSTQAAVAERDRAIAEREKALADLKETTARRISDLNGQIAVLRAEVEEVRRTAAADAEELVVSQLASAAADNARATADAVERARIDDHQAALSRAARLADGVRALDEARSLGDVLAALAECAGREVERAAVFVVKDGRLRGWRLSGFGAGAPAPRSLDYSLDEAGLAGGVVGTGVAVSGPAAAPDAAERQPALPPLAQDAGARHAMALPVTVGGSVVGVLYADAPRLDAPSASSRWPAVLDVLTRHASRVLEAMTVQQAAGLSLPRPVARGSHASLPGPIERSAQGDGEDAARRCARLLLSEIRMFNEPLIDAGRRSRDLLSRLSGEIARARRIYESRVPPEIPSRSEYFEQELVRTLADGDRSLLGSVQ